MSKLNFSVILNSYADSNSSNAPSLTNFKWNRENIGLTAKNPLCQTISIAASASRTIFSGSDIKKLVYIESNKLCNLTINGTINHSVKPLVINNSTLPGVFLNSSDITSLVIANPSATEALEVLLIAIE